MRISNIRITLINGTGGLISFASVLIDDCIRLDSIAIHQLANRAGYRIVYPRDKSGRPYFFPISQELREQLEDAIFDELGVVSHDRHHQD